MQTYSVTIFPRKRRAIYLVKENGKPIARYREDNLSSSDIEELEYSTSNDLRDRFKHSSSIYHVQL